MSICTTETAISLKCSAFCTAFQRVQRLLALATRQALVVVLAPAAGRRLFLDHVKVHGVAALLLLPPVAPQRDLFEDKVPGRAPILEGTVALQVAQEVGREHLLQGSSLGQVAQRLTLYLLQLFPLRFPVLQHLLAHLVVRDLLRVVDNVGQPLKAHAALGSHLPRDLPVGLGAADTVLLAHVLDRCQRAARAQQGEDGEELVIVPVQLHHALAVRQVDRSLHALPRLDTDLLIALLDPVEVRFELAQRTNKRLELELPIGERFLVAIEGRERAEALPLGQVHLRLVMHFRTSGALRLRLKDRDPSQVIVVAVIHRGHLRSERSNLGVRIDHHIS